MAPLSRFFLLAAVCGLIFLAPSASWSAHRLAGLKGPGAFQEEGSGWERPTGAGPPGNLTGDRPKPAGDLVLLAKAPSASKKKG